MKSLHELKQKGRALRKHLEAAFGKEVTLSQAYEALAAMEGAGSWNVLSASLAAETAVEPKNVSDRSGLVVNSDDTYVRAILCTSAGRLLLEFNAFHGLQKANEGQRAALLDERPQLAPTGFELSYGGGAAAMTIAGLCAVTNSSILNAFFDAKAYEQTFGEGKMLCFIDTFDVYHGQARLKSVVEPKSGFIERNDPSLTIVPNWAEFVAWAEDGGYDESYFDINHEKCLTLQQEYLLELSESPEIAINGEETQKLEYSDKNLFATLKVIEVNLVDVLNEYDAPDEVPDWKWVEQHHSFAHKGNGVDGGIWEYMVNVEKMQHVQDTPDTLRPFFDRAKKEGAAWVMFHQG
jgi:hypothetical protein